MKISLIIATYNKHLYLKSCLKSIEKLTCFPDEIIIADDGSDNRTKEVILEFIPKIKTPIIHEWQPDEGYRLTRSRNNGILRSTGEYTIFIDEDMILHPNFISDHRKLARKNCFYCGTRVRLGENKTNEVMENFRNHFLFLETDLKSRINAIRIPFLHKIIKGAGYTHKHLRGCNMAFWKSDLVTVDGFDEQFISWGRDDSDIALRMMHAGVKRINLKWVALAYHLHHEVKEPTSKNTGLMYETQQTKRIKAVKGLSGHTIH